MAKELKTKKTEQSVDEFLQTVPEEQKRKDCYEVIEIMKKVTGEEPKMWGTSMIGFGNFRYKSDSGQKGEWFLTGLSPRKQAITVYIITGFSNEKLMNRLGKFKTGGGCLYFKQLSDLDKNALQELIQQGVETTKAKYQPA